MRIFAIADLHLSFGENVNKPMDVFGPAWDHYEKRLEESWRDMVAPGDLVLIPGDISWAMHLADALPDLAWIDALPGKKILLRGNHDLWWSSLRKMREAAPGFTFLQNDAYIGEGFAVIGSRGWLCPGDRHFGTDDQKIYERELLRLGMSAAAAKKAQEESPVPLDIIGAMHYPPTNERKQPSGFTDIFREAGAKIVVYGHLHGEQAFSGGPQGLLDGTAYILCSLDKLGAVPRLIYEN